ncbi:pyruvate, water dikinase regulatory protein [Curvivirga sp.]|uniref:pyruvate, water dikinase regulatory protein n=1 Tax=Curvivirga sp. TaxID=2856848 RepID=UPI003B5A694E
MATFHLHLVSDSTGETVEHIARATLAQFESVTAIEHQWPMMRSVGQVEQVIQNILENPGVVMYTMVNEEMRQAIQAACRRHRLPCISLLDPVISFLGNYLGVKSKGQPGRQHNLDDEYFERIDAMQFALIHDDGQAPWDLEASDVVLVGVSRTSKTPTCIYLANRGLKAANVPFVPDVVMPQELLKLDPNNPDYPLVVGLTKDIDSLVQIRKSRLRHLSDKEDTGYADMDKVKEEVVACRRLCAEHGWPVINVSRRSIEETAAAVIKHVEMRKTRLQEKN